MANINIGGRLHSTATGNVVAGANEILDDTKGKKQSVINQETDEALAGKQAALVSGTNIKTVNGESILGSGNIQAGDPDAIKYSAQTLTDEQKTQARTNIGAYNKPVTGIPATDLASAAQASLGKADTAYQKPQSGVPKSDLASGVQDSLDLADTAVQAENVGPILPPPETDEFATKTQVTQLEAKVDGKIVMTKGAYIPANQGVGNVCPMTETAYNGMDCAIVNLPAGMTLYIKGVGGNSSRLWAVLDKTTHKILEVAEANTLAPNNPFEKTITASTDCIVVVNVYNENASPAYGNNAHTPYSVYISGALTYKVNAIEHEIDELVVEQSVNVTTDGTWQVGRCIVPDAVINSSYTGYRYMLFSALAGDIITYKGRADSNTSILAKQNADGVHYTSIVAGIGGDDYAEGTYTVLEDGIYCICGYNNYTTYASILRDGRVPILEQKVAQLETKSSSLAADVQSLEKNFDQTDLASELSGATVGYYVSWSDLSTQAQASYKMTAPIHLGRADRIELYAQCANMVCVICTCDANGNNKKRILQGNGWDNGFYLYEYIADNDCYVILSFSKSSANYANITRINALHKIAADSEAFAIESGSNLQAISDNPLALVKETPGFTSSIRTWGFVGDSLASGEIWGYKNGLSWHEDNYDISWGQFLCRITGAEGKNYSVGGQTAKWWVNNYLTPTDRSLAGVQADGGKQAYIIALGVNDAGSLDTLYGGKVATDMSNIAADIDLANPQNNANTFAGWYARVIQEIKAVAPDALIFTTVIPEIIGDDGEDMNTAISSMQTIFSSTYPNTIWTIDLRTYKPSQAYLAAFKTNGAHLNAQGYLYFAWQFITYIDWLIRKNMTAFKGLCFIGTGAHINND